MTVGLRRSMVVVDYLGGVGLWTWNLRFAGLAFGVCLEMRFRRFFFFFGGWVDTCLWGCGSIWAVDGMVPCFAALR